MNWKNKFPKSNIYFETDNGILYHGDCLEILKQISKNSINTIITSPPYNKKSQNKNFSKSNWKNANIKYDIYKDNLPEEEYQQWQKQIVKEMIRILKTNGSLFYNHKARLERNKLILPNEWLSDFNIRQLIIWDRGGSPNIENTRFFPTTEYIYWITKYPRTPKFYKKRALFDKEIWRMKPAKDNPHPAPFPEELPKNCILSTTDVDDIILDPFAGSGTTLLVAEQLRRKWIGIEISENYCETIKEQILTKGKNKNFFLDFF